MIKILKCFFGIISFLILAAIVGVIIFISQFDLNEYKPQIEKIVYEQTGRKLTLGGDIELKISLLPTFAVENVSLSNADWADQKPMVKIKEADVTLGILPLLKKQIEIENVRIIAPEINLASNQNGEGNWVFSKPASNNQNVESKPKEEKVDASAAPILAGIVAKELYISEGVLNYEDLKTKSKTNLTINTFEMLSDNMDDDIDIVYDVVFNGEKIQGSAITSSINTFLKGEPYNVTLNTKAYGAQVKANALLKDLTGDLTYQSEIDLTSSEGNFGLPKTQVVANVNGSLQVIDAVITKLNFGGNFLKANLNVNLADKKPLIKGIVSSDLFNLLLLQQKPKTAYFSLISSARAANFVPNDVLDLSVLNTINANIKFDFKKLILNEDISLDNLKGTADVSNGILKIKPFDFVAGTGPVSGDVTLDTKNNALTFNLDGKDVILQNFITSLNPKNGENFGFMDGGVSNFHIALTSNGKTYQNLVENLNGQLLFVVGESRIQAGTLKYLKGNFITQLLSALKLQAKDPKMSLKCAVLRADFKDGKANFPKGIVFDSKKMMVVGDGNINLKNDKIDIAIKPFNGNLTDTNIAQAVSSLVKVGGTISNPGIAIDTASVVKNVVGVALTGPAYIGSQLLLDADSAPCYTALKETTYSNMFEAPKGVKAGAQNVYQGTSDVVEGSINLITGTASGVAQGGANVLKGTAKGVLNLLSKKDKKKQ